jgi:hypothetical protein
VPEDVSVLGFDNTSTSLHVNPQLSTMAQPLEDMGRMAVKKLLRSRDLGPKIMPHRLVERGSTAPPHSTPAIRRQLTLRTPRCSSHGVFRHMAPAPRRALKRFQRCIAFDRTKPNSSALPARQNIAEGAPGQTERALHMRRTREAGQQPLIQSIGAGSLAGSEESATGAAFRFR